MSALPSGTVTFLITDIEGSTRLWEQYGEGMRPALALHDELLRSAVQEVGGMVVKHTGDGLVAVFPSAGDGLRAATVGQLRLAETTWPFPDPIRARMGLHSGEARAESGDYFGPTITRASRVAAAANGGQVVISDATQVLLGPGLPAPLTLRELGYHRLKDLSEPLRLFQVVDSRLPQDDRPLRSLEQVAHNLPVLRSPFVARGGELDRLGALVAQNRVVTLTGVGGVGKTRLALQGAANLSERFADGIWFVDLAPLEDPRLVVTEVASTLGVRELEGRALMASLVEAIGSKSLLLILDNCEHLIDAAADVVDGLVGRCPNLKIIATSREPLSVDGEATWRVPSLAVDPSDTEPSPASRLLYERIRSIDPEFQPGPAEFRLMQQIGERLDGIPLAIELAAGRYRSLSLAEILHRLDDRFRLLAGGVRTALPRQRTLQATVDWSWDLLDEEARHLLRSLAVFMGGFTLEAVEAICAGEELASSAIFDHLDHLVGASLVDHDQTTGRYRLLETIRQYAQDRLFESGEGSVLRQRHAARFTAWSEDLAARILGGDQSEVVRLFTSDIDNLRAALRWSIDSRDAETALRLVAALTQYWVIRSDKSEGEWAATEALAITGPDANEILYARALHAAAIFSPDVATRSRLVDEGLALSERLGDRRGLIESLNQRGLINRFIRRDPEAAISDWQRALELAGDDDPFTAPLLANLGYLRLERGEDLDTDALAERLTHLGDHWGILYKQWGLVWKAQGELLRGRYAESLQLAMQALSLAEEIGSKDQALASHVQLGMVAAAQGDKRRQAEEMSRALELAEATSLPMDIDDDDLYVLTIATLIDQGEYGLAAGLAGAARIDPGSQPALWALGREGWSRRLEVLEKALGADERRQAVAAVAGETRRDLIDRAHLALRQIALAG